MKSQPAVSICIPTYNGVEYLVQAIESARNQTFTDFELLIVDDCSSDNTLEIAYTFEKSDARIKVYKNEKNLGLVGNWNQCISLAKGNWIKFLFQDDFLAPDCLEEMMKVSPGQMLIIAKREYVFEEGVSEKDRKDYRKLERKYSFATLFKSYSRLNTTQFSKALAKNPAVNIWGEPTSMLISKEAFIQHGLFDQLFRQTCDYEYWARLGINYGVGLVHKKLIFFRVHSKSTTMSNHAEKAFYVNFYDFFAFAHKLLYDPLYSKFRSDMDTTHYPIIDYELARHARNLKKWQSGDTSFTEIAKSNFPEFNKYFINPESELLKSQLKLFFKLPLVFLSMVAGKIGSEIKKITN